MPSYSKIIALNGGAETKASLEKGSELPVFGLRSREAAIFVSDGKINVYSDNEIWDFTDALVFNRYPTDTHFCGILLEYLTFCNNPILNRQSLSYKRSSEKTAQMVRMAMNGLPVPKTFILHRGYYETYLPQVEGALQYPMVCKIDGIKGEKVAKVESRKELHQFLDGVDEIEIFICQEMIENDGDIRIICALGENLGAIMRTSSPGAFLNNYAQGGTVSKYEPTEEEVALAIKACAVNNFDIAGVDIMHTSSGPTIIEVNMGPGVDGFESVHGTDVVFTTIGKKLNGHIE